MIECRLEQQSLIASLPKLVLSVGFDSFATDPLDLLARCVIENANSPTEQDGGAVVCSLHIVIHEHKAILGQPFFMSNLVVFDKANKRIGRPL